jgi:hypothetical protein
MTDQMEEPRWTATITNLHDSGPVEVVHDLVELAELHDLVEAGPHWDTIVDIRITRCKDNMTDGPLTVEEAREI